MTQLLNFVERKPMLTILVLALFLRIISAFFANGFYAHDDYYHIVDISWAWTEGVDKDNWFVDDYSENTKLRNVIYPGIVYAQLMFAKAIGVSEPFYQMVVVQLFHAFYSLLIVFFAYRITEAISDKKSALIVGLLTAGLWFFPFLSVRTMTEWTSIPIVLFAIDRYYVPQKRKTLDYLLIGAALAFAFAVRYQTSFFTLGFGLGILIKDKWKPFFIMSVGFILSSLIVQGLGDYLVCGMPFGKLIEYIKYNIENSGNFVSRPIYDYILLLPVLLIPPIGAMIFYFVFRKGFKCLPLFLSIVIFLGFHSVYENKQERFVFTIIPMIIILGVPFLLEQMRKPWWSRSKRSWFWGVFIFINTYLLVLMTINYTKKSKIEALRYLRAQGDVEQIYFVNVDKHGTGQPVNMVPQFYYGERFEPVLIGDSLTLEVFTPDSISSHSYFLFEVHPDKDFETYRLDRAQKYFGELEYKTRIHGSLIDNFRFRLNPIVKNEEYVIFEKK